MITVGKLRHLLFLEKEVRTPDGVGGFTTQWVKQAHLFAAIEPYSGGYALQSQQMTAAITHRITLRWRADVATGMRLTTGVRHFYILAALNRKEEKHWLDILAEERLV